MPATAISATPESPRTPDASLCVIVSHWDGHDAQALLALLRSLVALPEVQAGHGLAPRSPNATVDAVVKVVVNQSQPAPLSLPPDLSHVQVAHRPNGGYNVGAWDFGWRRWLHRHYVFVQDECVLQHPSALRRYAQALRRHPLTLWGESLQCWRSWRDFQVDTPAIHAAIERLAIPMGLSLGNDPTHLQSLAVGASREALLRLDGFLMADDKVEAMALETLWSLRAQALGLDVAQLGWLPFSQFFHPQWDGVVARARTASWHLGRLAWHVGYSWRHPPRLRR